MTADPTAAFGAALRARRRQLGLTLEQVAVRAHTDFTCLSRIERGRYSPTLAAAARYAAAYESTLADLLREPA